MINERVSNLIVSSGSASQVPSAKYIGYWPMTQWTSLTTYDGVVGVSTTVVDATNNWITGFTGAAWAVAGTPVKVKSSTGVMPGGILSTDIYYAGKPTADQMTFHATKTAALAGTGIIDITSQGTGNITVYPVYVKDWSGQGNDLLYGAINDLNAFATFPYMSSVSSGSADGSVGLLPMATLSARFVWPTDTFLCMFRVKFGSPLVQGRSFFGNGQSGSLHGPRVLVGSGDPTKITLQVAHAGTVITATTAAEGVSTTIEHHIALALEGPTKRATIWIDGVRDINIASLSLSTVSALNFTSDLRIGGATSTNSHIAGFCDYHAFAWAGSLPTNIDALIARSASARYHRLSSSDL